MSDTPRPTDGTTSAEDQALLDDLAAALAEVDPVPPHLLEAAKASWTWRTVDAELAALVGDSAVEPLKVRTASGGDGPRTLTFEVGGTALVVEVTRTGLARRLLGQILRPRSAEVEVRSPHGGATVTADDSGRFSADGVPAGPVSLVCRFLDGERVATSWVAV